MDKEAMLANITTGYRTTGVYPNNPSVIPDAKFAPILLTTVRTLKSPTL